MRNQCRVFAGAVADGGSVKALCIPDGSRISNSRVKPKGDIANEAVAAGESPEMISVISDHLNDTSRILAPSD